MAAWSSSHVARLALLAAALFSGIPASASARSDIDTAAPRFVYFDVPGAACVAESNFAGCDGTVPRAISDNGTIVGTYRDTGGGTHEFIRYPNGTFQKTELYGIAINTFGVMVGETTKPDGSDAGFVRNPDGHVTVFAAARQAYTWAAAINPLGTIVGGDCCVGRSHGLLRKPDGTVISLDVPGAASSGPTGINLFGAVTGWFYDRAHGYNTISHGYVRDPDGHFTKFSGPGVCRNSMVPSSISLDGTIVGVCGYSRGFIRAPTGNITLFGPAGGSTASAMISPFGTIAGEVSSGDPFEPVSHGYIRERDGTMTLIDVPGAIWTEIVGINAWGAVTGSYIDRGFNWHPFLRLPALPLLH